MAQPERVAPTRRVAIVHDWLTGMRGGEYVLEAILELFPEAPIYTLIHDKGSVSRTIESHSIVTSPLQRVPGIFSKYRHFLPTFPAVIRRFDFRGFDLIISSSHCVAKGIKRPHGAKHISYVHAPMRYMWDRFDDYFGPDKAGPIVRLGAKSLRPWLKNWDRRVSQKNNVDLLIANSHFISGQIKSCYGRDSIVIHPFMDATRFSGPRQPSDRYLVVSAFAPNKRIDLAIEACTKLNRKLDIIGTGQDEARLRKMAGPQIRFLGNQTNEQIAQAYSEARAFIFPGLEDFGITPLEAMASGTPVIAFKGGGVLETLTPETAVFFEEPTAASLADAITKFESGEHAISEASSRARAREFSRERFKREFGNSLNLTQTQSS